MAESVNRRISKKVGREADEVLEFTLTGADPIGSPTRVELPAAADITAEPLAEAGSELAAPSEYSPEFLELAQAFTLHDSINTMFKSPLYRYYGRTGDYVPLRTELPLRP